MVKKTKIVKYAYGYDVIYTRPMLFGNKIVQSHELREAFESYKNAKRFQRKILKDIKIDEIKLKKQLKRK